MKQKQRISVTEQELLTILMGIEKPTFTYIVSKTKVRMNKGGNPYYEKITKHSKGQYFIGGTYEDMVNTRCVKEGIEPNFESEECKVGEHITKCVQFNEKFQRYYLQYFIFPTSNIKSEYIFEGDRIERELFRSHEVKKSESSRQPQENKHKPQSFMLSSIEEITLNGTEYVVIR